MKNYNISTKYFFSCVVIFLLLTAFVSAQTPDALKLYREGNYDAAIEACKNEINARPGNMDSYAVLGWSLMAKRQYNEAFYWATEGLKIVPNDHRIVEVLGEANYYLGNNEDALRLFERYVVLVPSGARIGAVYYFMGEIYIRQAKFKTADISLTAANRYEPQNAYWATRLGYAREMTEDYINAAKAYDTALQLNPQLSDAIRGKERISEHLN